MPTYAYRCASCEHSFEQYQAFTDDALTTCPSCGASELRKVFNSIGVTFKGSGFYRTDSRAGTGADSKGGSKSGTQSGSGSKGGAADSGSGSSGSDPGSGSGSGSGSGAKSKDGASSSSSGATSAKPAVTPSKA